MNEEEAAAISFIYRALASRCLCSISWTFDHEKVNKWEHPQALHYIKFSTIPWWSLVTRIGSGPRMK